MEFNSALEKKNFTDFVYSVDGFKFISMLFECYNSDYIFPSRVFPHVDWHKSWTVEEILKEYNYSDEEIKAVMNDLHSGKYKYLNNN